MSCERAQAKISTVMTTLAYLGSPAQWLVLILACLVIFGAKRLPELARTLGRAVGEFGKARREFENALRESSQETNEQQADTEQKH